MLRFIMIYTFLLSLGCSSNKNEYTKVDSIQLSIKENEDAFEVSVINKFVSVEVICTTNV